MKIFQRIKNRFNPTNGEKRSIISRRFIIAISIIYSLLIVAFAFSFHYTMHKNRAILRESIVAHNQHAILQSLDSLAGRIRGGSGMTIEDLKAELLRHNAAGGDILSGLFFTKTEDENFFRIAGTVSFDRSFTLNVPRSGVVREQKEINYLKKGLMHSIVDPDVYAQGPSDWQNAYLPIKINGKKGVLQLLVSVSKTREVIDAYDESVEGVRIFVSILTLALVIAVVALSVVFLHNYSLLIGNLSQFMKKAADGDLDVSLNETDDIELNRLALSFNTLIDELKDRTEKAAADAEPSQDAGVLGTIFDTGVSMLKENRIEESIAIFRTMTIMKPGAFGSYFNLGVAYAKKREYARAIRMFEEARRLNPSFEITTAYIEKLMRLQHADD